MSDLYQCVFSDDRIYRYTLRHTWDVSKGTIQFVGLNPSTADERSLDPTLKRCINFATRWGYGALVMTNIFAFRATHQKVMKEERSPIGRDNDHWLKTIAREADMIIAAWGRHGAHMGRGDEVREMMRGFKRDLYILNPEYPKHPLARGVHRIPDDTQPILWH